MRDREIIKERGRESSIAQEIERRRERKKERERLKES